MLSLHKTIWFLPLWLTQLYYRRQLVQAISNSYRLWQQYHYNWVNSGFDDYFLLHDAFPLLYTMLVAGHKVEPQALAVKWAEVYRLQGSRADRAVTECMPAADHFLTLLQAEYHTLQLKMNNSLAAPVPL